MVYGTHMIYGIARLSNKVEIALLSCSINPGRIKGLRERDSRPFDSSLVYAHTQSRIHVRVRHPFPYFQRLEPGSLKAFLGDAIAPTALGGNMSSV